jgi:hypothetical protein
MINSYQKSFVRVLPIHKLILILGCLTLAFWLTGCGGGTSVSSNNSQNPVDNPTQAPADDSGAQSPQTDNSNSSSDTGIPATAKVREAIQTLSDWQWCTKKLRGKICAAGLGEATSTMTPDQQDPSLSGHSSKFTLGGETHYSNALWWKQFGMDKKSKHFVYDLYFYLNDAHAPQALEFDINQGMDGVRYTWGTECSYRDSGHWDIWNPEGGEWVTTSVKCPEVEANTWHHLIWTVERVDGKLHYISVELDGKVSEVDKYFNPQRDWPGEILTVAFQMDGNYRQDPYKVWLDNVTLSAW